jgi:hypothetical protein
MGKRKSKAKRSWLLGKCKARGITVAALTRKVRCSRFSVYFAIERPSRHSLTFVPVNKEAGLRNTVARLKRLVIAPLASSCR